MSRIRRLKRISGRTQLVLKLLLSASTLLGCLVVLEIALRCYYSMGQSATEEVPYGVLVDSPVVYRPNPARPDIGPQGLRDDAVAIPKPDDVCRILVLGDSVTFGFGVQRDQAFAHRLEVLFRDQGRKVEVLNAGVNGYSTYNELAFYEHHGREFDPDLVLVAFCLNDVVNPRLHWSTVDVTVHDVPAGAIPNAEYDRLHVEPILQARTRRARQDRWVAWSRLAKVGTHRIRTLAGTSGREHYPPCDGKPANGAQWLTHLTAEDSISIEVLMDDSSPEWQWLTSTYRKLSEAVAEDGAKFAVALFPLAYQLDERYPLIPQRRLQQHFDDQGIPCIDLLASLRRHRQSDTFLLDTDKHYDVWHLTPDGHQVAAEQLEKFLVKQGALESEP